LYPRLRNSLMLSETEFIATVLAKVGPLKARFTGRVELSEI
jgi:uncharacterized protein